MAMNATYELYRQRREEVSRQDRIDNCGRNGPPLNDGERCISLCFEDNWDKKKASSENRCNRRRIGQSYHCYVHRELCGILNKMQHRYDDVPGIDLTPHAGPVAGRLKYLFEKKYGDDVYDKFPPHQIREMIVELRKSPYVRENLLTIPQLQEGRPSARIAKFIVSKYEADVRLKIDTQCFFGKMDLGHILATEAAGFYYDANVSYYDIHSNYGVDAYASAFEFLYSNRRYITLILQNVKYLKYFMLFNSLKNPADILLAKCIYRELQQLARDQNNQRLLKSYGGVKDDTKVARLQGMENVRNMRDILTAISERRLDYLEEPPAPPGTPVGFMPPQGYQSLAPSGLQNFIEEMEIDPMGSFLPG